jgi:predicted ATPase
MSGPLPKVQELTLENFTAFEQVTFDFCPGINVLVGANATGKSHVMKVVYTLLKTYEAALRQGKNIADYEVEVLADAMVPDIFQINSLGELVREGEEEAEVSFKYNNEHTALGINRQEDDLYVGEELKGLSEIAPVIYLPTQEFLSINEGFIAVYNKRELPYDQTYYDLSLALNALPLRKDRLLDVQEVLTFLREIIAGEQVGEEEIITQENGRFQFSLPEGKLDVHLVAEGYRKLATLYYLLRNGSLTKESILLWDEPEANLNPKLIVQVVKVLQMLAAVGMQVFVTTHDYLLSYGLSLLAEYPTDTPVEIKFFVLHKPARTAGVLVESARTLAEIEHNPILEEFAAHYERESALFHQSATVDEPGR